MRLFKYKEAFRVSVKHDYFKDGYSPSFSFAPSEYCQMLLKNHSLKFKPAPYGFSVFGEVSGLEDDEKLMQGFQEGVKFTFLMKLKNPFFLNFTDIPLQLDPQEIFYFNNLIDYETNGELFLINKDEIPKISSNQSQTIICSEIYTYMHTGVESSKTGTVTFIDEGFEIEQTIENNNDEFHFQFNLGNFNPGRCEFSVDSISETFYSGGEIYKQGGFGIIEIFANSSVPSNYRFVDSENTISTKEYIVPFTNRSTIWRYLIYDKSTNTLSNPQIDMTGTEFRVESFPAVSYPDDYALFRFTSAQPGSLDTEKALPLTEEPITDIELSGTINNTNKEIIEHLPNPDITLIKPDTEDNEKIYSDMIIYL